MRLYATDIRPDGRPRGFPARMFTHPARFLDEVLKRTLHPHNERSGKW